jgi:cell wall assembly regulator SMI1
LPSLYDFATWGPLLRILRADNAERLAVPGAEVSGLIGRGGWSLPTRTRAPRPGQALQISDMPEFDAADLVVDALAAAGTDHVAFTAGIAQDGATVLHLLGPSPAVQPALSGPHPGAMTLVAGAAPAPWHRLPAPAPGAAPAASADPVLLERTLRERLPGAVGATGAEIAAAQARLGVPLPAELAALYRVTRGRAEDWPDHAAADRAADAVGCELLPLDELHVADAASRTFRWESAATAVLTQAPGAAVQPLVGSPGWIAFAGNGAGDRLAVDLTPGPGGHLGQVVVIPHQQDTGACLLADSLTDLVVHLRTDTCDPYTSPAGQAPAVAEVRTRGLPDVEAAAHPDLEVLRIGARNGPPLSLAPVTGLPRLRTLTARPGTLADPLEIARLTGLEYLEIAPEDWRALLDAHAVPRTLAAASVHVHGARRVLPVVDLVNEILALWHRPPIPRTTVTGHLGAAPPAGSGGRWARTR